MQKGVSVVIACFNSAKVIKNTLEHLQKQKNIEDINWEIVLVDNNSSDNTSEIARNIWNSNPIVPINIILEKKIGEANARLSGIKAARYDIISIVDDDNWVYENWIYKIVDYFNNTEIGLIGCAGVGEFEEPPPFWFHENQTAFAIGKLTEGHFVDFTNEGLVPGAGLSLRKEIYDKLFSLGWQPKLQGRVGNTQSAGADSEMCLATRLLGYKIFYSNELTFKHFTAKPRITWERLLKMTEGFGRSDVFTLPYIILYQEMSGNATLSSKLKKIWWLNIIVKKILLYIKDPFPSLRKNKYSWKTIYRVRTLAFCEAMKENHSKFNNSFTDLEKIINMKNKC